jgi:hypothetical protein
MRSVNLYVLSEIHFNVFMAFAVLLQFNQRLRVLTMFPIDLSVIRDQAYAGCDSGDLTYWNVWHAADLHIIMLLTC